MLVLGSSKDKKVNSRTPQEWVKECLTVNSVLLTKRSWWCKLSKTELLPPTCWCATSKWTTYWVTKKPKTVSTLTPRTSMPKMTMVISHAVTSLISNSCISAAPGQWIFDRYWSISDKSIHSINVDNLQRWNVTFINCQTIFHPFKNWDSILKPLLINIDCRITGIQFEKEKSKTFLFKVKYKVSRREPNDWVSLYV